jgi:flagellar hook-associated protein 1 FlgK
LSLSNAINAARSGLQISGLRADMVATNISNAETPGYVRRSVMLSETMTGNNSAGVRSDGVTRSADAALTTQRMSAGSDAAQANLIASTWGSLSAMVGNTTDGAGLFNLLSNLESAFATAVESPESAAGLNGIIDAASAIIDEFRGLSQHVSAERMEADREIAKGVDTINAALKSIEMLNVKIASSDRSSGGAAALMDERQRVVDTISEYLPVQSVDRPGGQIDIVTREGVFLLAGQAREIQFSPTPGFGPGDTITDGTLSGLSVEGLDLTPGSQSYSAVSSGLFGALFTLRDDDLPAFNAQLDTVASDLLARLSADGVDPTLDPGDPGMIMDTNPGAGAGVAGRLTLNPIIDPQNGGELRHLRDGLGSTNAGPPGDNSILSALFDAMAATRSIGSGRLQGSFTASGLAAGFASVTGQMRLSSEAVQSSAATQHSLLVESERSETGVDVDEQMQQLLLIEQAYAANARVIETANQMLQRLMDMI